MTAGWGPAVVLGVAAILATVGVRAQRTLPLRGSLGAAIPLEIEAHRGRPLSLSADEEAAAGVSNYMMRVYLPVDSTAGAGFSVYVGYYDRQGQGRTIHSPKNCLPGSGWEALASTTADIGTASGSVRVNRYLLQRGNQRALVLYWYQGRGRVAWSEYAVKLHLLRDAALRRRSDEALVRIVVPVGADEQAAMAAAARVAQLLVPALWSVLPA